MVVVVVFVGGVLFMLVMFFMLFVVFGCVDVGRLVVRMRRVIVVCFFVNMMWNFFEVW